MPTFAYTARDQRGSAHTGSVDGADEEQVLALLQQRGLLVTSISQKTLSSSAATAPGSFRHRRARHLHGRVTTVDHLLLCQQLA
jgi:type II secretory pathway component PulF